MILLVQESSCFTWSTAHLRTYILSSAQGELSAKIYGENGLSFSDRQGADLRYLSLGNFLGRSGLPEMYMLPYKKK